MLNLASAVGALRWDSIFIRLQFRGRPEMLQSFCTTSKSELPFVTSR
jgi:hypothetical protein